MEAIREGDFNPQLYSSAIKVIIVLTQSWCPQWMFLKESLRDIEEENPDIKIYYVEYDLEDFFRHFMDFKEQVYENFQVPYIRYFKNGKEIGQSNYTDKSGVLSFFKED